MVAGWAAEGIGTKRVMRLPGKLPGLYMIQTDDKGERRFFHWRESAAARSLMDLPETVEILNSLADYDVVYLSAITLSLYGGEGRERLFAAIERARDGWDPLCLRYQFPRTRLARPERRARASSALPLQMPISCWPRPRICCRSIQAKATKRLLARHSRCRGRAEAFRAGEHLRLDGVPIAIKAEPVTEAGRRYHGGRRQFCGGLYRRAPEARIRSKPRAPDIVSPALWYAIPARSSRARRCRQEIVRHATISRKAIP